MFKVFTPVIVLTFLVFYLQMNVQAQVRPKAFTIQGKFITGQKLPAADVVVYLLQAADQKMFKVEYADDEGIFIFEGIPEGIYLITTEGLGFKKYSSGRVNLDKNINMGEISLSLQENKLKEVSISAIKPFITQQYDRTVLDVAGSISAAGSSALEVLQKAPGITLDQQDNIAMRGRQGVLLMIDGKLVPMSGQELADMLRAMSASQIEKINLISNPSAKYDAAGNSGIIDIRLKREKNEGVNGNVALSYGQGVYGKFIPAVNLSSKSRKLSLFASYAYSPRNEFNDLTIFRTFYDASDQITGGNNFHNFFRYRFHNHNARIGADYSLSKKITLGFVVNGLFVDGKVGSDGKASSLDALQQPSGTFNTLGSTNPVRNNGGLNLNYRQQMDTAGTELSADFDYARYRNSDLQNYHTDYYDSNGNPAKSAYDLFGDLNGNLSIRSFKVDYTLPLKQLGAKLEAGIKASWVKTDNDVQFFDRSAGGNILDAGKSNRFIYQENIYAAYLNASKKWKKWSMQLGLRLEHTAADGLQVVDETRFNKDYVQLFPSGYIGYEWNETHDLGISVSRRINRPSYRELNPFKVFLDPLTSASGNPQLDPEKTIAFELTHSFKHKYITKLGYSRTTDNIISVLSPDMEPGTVIQTGRNLASYNYYNISLGIPVTLGKWLNSTNTALVFYGKYQGYLANTNLNAGRMAFSFNSSNSVLLNTNTTFEITGSYNSRAYYGFLDINANWSLNLGAQRQLWNKRASVKLNVNDVFLSLRTKAITKLTGYGERFIQLRDTRVGMISFNYKFGGSPANAKRKAGAAEEEKRRAGN